MSRLSQQEIVTQKRLIDLFTKQMGYEYLGDWRDRDNNSNIEEGYYHKIWLHVAIAKRRFLERLIC